MSEPSKKPNAGEINMNMMVCRILSAIRTANPLFATAAPIRPPISACEEDEGMP